MATILVVDDEPDIRYLVQVNLELDGHVVRTAGNGAEALESIAAERPDVVLLDVMMPGRDGWSVLDAIKGDRDEAVKTIPVLMLSALSGPSDSVRGRIGGAVRYLIKPIAPDDLRAAVQAALNGDPEPAQRRRALHSALEDIARMESGDASPRRAPSAVRPRLSRLEHEPAQPVRPRPTPELQAKLTTLTDRQLELLEALYVTPTVSRAAESLGMSRSNVYASLRRISRKLGVGTAPELLTLLRSGGVLDAVDAQGPAPATG